MMNEYQTIDYKDKLHEQYQNKINSLLCVLPDYCVGYENYIRNHNSIKTRMEYLVDIYNFFRYLSLNKYKEKNTRDITLENLAKLTGFDFDDYLSWLTSYKFDVTNENEKLKENSLASKKRKLMAVKSLFHFLYVRDLIPCNPSEKAITPKVKSKKRCSIRILEDNEYDLFLDCIERKYNDAISLLKTKSEEKQTEKEKLRPSMILRDKAIIYLFLGTGLRVSELCAINCSNISWELDYINVIRKEDSDDDTTTDQVYLNPQVKKILLNYIQNARENLSPNPDNYDALFISSKHCRITPRAVELLVKEYADAALGTGNGITPHKLRATFGTRYYQKYKDISATSTVMNHAGIEITAKYYIQEDKAAKEKVKDMRI